MAHPTLIVGMFLGTIRLTAQEIHFDQGNWQDHDLSHQRVVATMRLNEARVDTVYIEDIATGALEMSIQRYPLARYEYHPATDAFPTLLRRVDIRQEVVVDTMFVENISTGALEMVVQKRVKDIPNGAYHEFFPNGNIRIKGTLDGYDQDGMLKKTGEWKEWDANGNMIRQETYP